MTPHKKERNTVMILSFRTDRPGQAVQTQIRLLLEEQSDQGLHCLPFRLHSLDSLVYDKATSSNFRVIATNVLGVRKLRIITVVAGIKFDALMSILLGRTCISFCTFFRSEESRCKIF